VVLLKIEEVFIGHVDSLAVVKKKYKKFLKIVPFHFYKLFIF
jgi:hypothetical protein